MTEPRNLSAIAFQCMTAMAFGRRVELVLVSGASVKGVPTRIVEDLVRKSDATRGVNHSHLRIELDRGRDTVDVDRIRKVQPTL
jgi:hypothetical protein